MHPEALTSDTKKLWPELKHFPDFVLAGGTALALQSGHRTSVDFDFFSEREIEPGLLTKVEGVFKRAAVTTVLNTPEQLTVRVDGTNLTFLTYRFPPIDDPIVYEGVRLFTVPDIAATKAYALGRRATLKTTLIFTSSWRRVIARSPPLRLSPRRNTGISLTHDCFSSSSCI